MGCCFFVFLISKLTKDTILAHLPTVSLGSFPKAPSPLHTVAPSVLPSNLSPTTTTVRSSPWELLLGKMKKRESCWTSFISWELMIKSPVRAQKCYKHRKKWSEQFLNGWTSVRYKILLGFITLTMKCFRVNTEKGGSTPTKIAMPQYFKVVQYIRIPACLPPPKILPLQK